MSVKEAIMAAARSVRTKCEAIFVRFPKVWSEQDLMRNIGATVLLHKNVADGTFNEDNAVNELKDKYGVDESKKVVEIDLVDGDTDKKKKKRKSVDKDTDVEEGEKTKKVKKTETMANEANREYHDAIKEIADLYFQQKDMRKGGVFSKGAKAIRECTTAITSKKEAKALSGIGEGMAAYWEELKTTGMILKLEELRAGN